MSKWCGGAASIGPSRVSAGQAASMNWRNRASASGAGSLALTSMPRDRNVAAQLMPIVPVPITATRRMLRCCMMRLPRLACRPRWRIDERGPVLLRSGDPSADPELNWPCPSRPRHAICVSTSFAACR